MTTLPRGSGAVGPKPIGRETFKARRAALLGSLAHGTVVLYSHGRSDDAGYRADADFWYLTGINESGAILVLARDEVDSPSSHPGTWTPSDGPDLTLR